VTLRRSDAPTGRKKNTPMRRRAGARKTHAARACLASPGDRFARENPAPLLENLIHIAIERGEGARGGDVPANRRLRCFDQLAGDDFNFRNFGDGLDALQLCVEGTEMCISAQGSIPPRGDARGEITR
jgi:hypothetical protein